MKNEKFIGHMTKEEAEQWTNDIVRPVKDMTEAMLDIQKFCNALVLALRKVFKINTLNE